MRLRSQRRHAAAGAIVLALAACAALGAQSPAPARTIEWTRITLPFETGVPPWREPVWMFNPATKSTFVGANKTGLFETKDLGDSWTRVDDGSFVTSGHNVDNYTLHVGPKGQLYSIDIASGVYKSENDGRSWTKQFPLNGYKGRIWVDSGRPAHIYLMTQKATEGEPAQTYVEVDRSVNAGASFQELDLKPSSTESLDVLDRLVCWAEAAAISCSENQTTRRALSLTPIARSLEIDRNLNMSVGVTINKTNRELVILSGGTVYETRNARTTIVAKVGKGKIPGRTIDVIFDPTTTFPAYGISGLDPDGPWTLTKIGPAGDVESYAGPKPRGFRLRAVDLAHDTFYVWTLEGYYRGVLK